MLEFGSFVQEARAPAASATPPPSMFAVPLSDHTAVALLFQRQRLSLMFPHRGLGARDAASACRTGSILSHGRAGVSLERSRTPREDHDTLQASRLALEVRFTS